MSLGWGCTQLLSVEAAATAEHLGTQTPSTGNQQGTQTFQPRCRVLVNHPRTDGGGANEAPPQLKSYQQVKAAGLEWGKSIIHRAVACTSRQYY